MAQVFDIPPWHPSAEVTRVHVYSGEKLRTPPRRFEGQSCSFISLPDPLRPEHLPGADERVRDAIGDDASRVELSIGGPVALGFYLGWELRNHRAVVRCLHAQDGERPWWHNQHSPLDRGPWGIDGTEHRVVVMVGGGRDIPTG